jgi:feruloyl-CoA synthase
LRETFFRRLRLMMYAGAGMGRHTWDRLTALAERTRGARIPLGTGLGSTETGPFAMHSDRDAPEPGNVGIPAQGVELKLVPAAGRLEARLRGPAITPGYFRNPELTRAAFDEEGFYRIGDALRFAVPGDPARGFLFDGRITENFKLATGTWVGVGALRAALVDAFAGLVRDAAITGENRRELGALLVPFLPAMRAIAGVEPDLDDWDLLNHRVVRARLTELLSRHAAASTGSASRVVRVMVLTDPPSLDHGEVTDKGSLNQRALLRQRAGLVEALYDDADPRVIRADPRQTPP